MRRPLASLLAAVALLAPAAAALAEGGGEPVLSAEDEEKLLAKKREELKAAEAARDAARMNFLNYGLPKYSLEVEAKQREIDRLKEEIAELEK